MAPASAMTPVREAWRTYVSTGALRQGVLREPIFRAWERCHAFGTSAVQARAESLSPEGTRRLLEGKANLVAAARPFMAALSRGAGLERHAAMLGDERGVVLDIVGDEETVHGPDPFPGPGALLAETVSGANGVGTPLAAGAYVELVGPEHFIGGFHAFTCQGTPVRGPDGAVAGVISTSVRRVAASARLRQILVCAAGGIEAELLRARLEEDVRRVVSSPSAGGLARLRDDVLQSFTSARVRLDVASRHAAKHHFGATLALVAEAQRAIDRFQRQARLWRDLAANEVGTRQPVALDRLAADVTDLLQTESRMRRVELRADALEPALVSADARELSRTVFGAILDAIERVEAGGVVHVSTRAPRSLGPATLHVRAQPASAAGDPVDRVLSFPSAP